VAIVAVAAIVAGTGSLADLGIEAIVHIVRRLDQNQRCLESEYLGS